MGDPRVVMVAGATGLVGRELVRQLVAHSAVAEVRALARRPLPPDPGWGAAERRRFFSEVVDFERLPNVLNSFSGVDTIFCALGTTIRDAGSRDAFRRVDHDYVVELARLGRDAGARHFLVVSALGADSRSRVFYNRVKGEMEADLRALGLPMLTIARPSLLVGARERSRPLEKWMGILATLVPSRWKPVSGRQVAKALLLAARLGSGLASAAAVGGVEILENSELRSA